MRLAQLDHGHDWYLKAFFGLIRLTSRSEPPDIIKTLFYRPELFGMRFSDLTQEVLRGESSWTVGERELFAAFTSSLNQCVF